jgi:hypothetical protein
LKNSFQRNDSSSLEPNIFVPHPESIAAPPTAAALAAPLRKSRLPHPFACRQSFAFCYLSVVFFPRSMRFPYLFLLKGGEYIVGHRFLKSGEWGS